MAASPDTQSREMVRLPNSPSTMDDLPNQLKLCRMEAVPNEAVCSSPDSWGEVAKFVHSDRAVLDLHGNSDGCYASALLDGVDKLGEADDIEDGNAMGNGCGEAVSPTSSCAPAGVPEEFYASAGKSLLQWSVAPLPLLPAEASESAMGAEVAEVSLSTAADAVVVLLPQTSTLPKDSTDVSKGAAFQRSTSKQHPLGRSLPPKYTHLSTSFASKAIQAITLHASTADAPLPPHNASSNLSSTAASTAHLISGDDPIGVRQLYSLPGSRAGSSLSYSTRAVESKTSVAVDTFSMERFAAFYEVALKELMDECERRVANAPAAWRENQQQFIRGRSNGDLAVSTLSFDSPRSNLSSPLGDGLSLPGRKRHFPPLPSCLPCASNETRGSYNREQSGDFNGGSGVAQSEAPSMPRPNAFFTVSSEVRPTDLDKGMTAEKSVPGLLVALGRHHGKMAPMVFIAALAYLARVTVQCASELLSVTHTNWYRLTTTAILVAAKVYDEHSSSHLNAHFAKSSGIPLKEIMKLELDFLYLIDFDLLLKESEVEQWLSWMETLAVRRDLMTPLNAFVFGTSTSTAASAPDTKVLHSTTGSKAAPWGEHAKARAACETSATGGLTSEGHGSWDEKASSLFSGGGQRSFPKGQITGCSPASARKEVVEAPTSGREAGALSEASERAAHWATTGAGRGADELRGSISSLVLPENPVDGAGGSSLSAAYLGGQTSRFLQGWCQAPLRLPAHEALPPHLLPTKARLFSVVHGVADPPSPRSVRELSRLGNSPPSPLRPPSIERHSPVQFFKTQGAHAHGSSRRVDANAVDHNVRDPCSVHQQGALRASQEHLTRKARPTIVSEASLDAPAAESPPPKSRWGPLGMVQQVRDVLGVTASLVRGQVNVLARSTHTHDARWPPPAVPQSWMAVKAAPHGIHDGLGHSLSQTSAAFPKRSANIMKDESGRSSYSLARSGDNRLTHAGGFASSAASAAAVSPPPPCPSSMACAVGNSLSQYLTGYGNRSDELPSSSAVAQPSIFTPAPSLYADPRSFTQQRMCSGTGEHPVMLIAPYPSPAAPAYYTVDEEVDGYVEGEEEEEDEEFYEEEEEEEEEGYEEEEDYWYADQEEEEEDEAAYFQRCRPPLTHSPPSL